MSALGQKRTLRCVEPMSALPPKADIAERNWDVRFVPKADSSIAVIDYLLDCLVGERRAGRCLQAGTQIRLAGLVHRQFKLKNRIWSAVAPCHHTQSIAAKVPTTGRLLTLMRPVPG